MPSASWSVALDGGGEECIQLACRVTLKCGCDVEILGHSNTTLTINIYSHVLPDLQREAAAKMDAILVGADARS